MKLSREIKRSIKWRLTVMYICLVVAILFVIMFANTFLLGSYYMREKVRTLESSYNALDSIITEAYQSGKTIDDIFPADYDSTDSSKETEATRYIKSLGESNNISIVILDTESDRVFDSSTDSNFQLKKLNQYILGNRSNMEGTVLERFENYSIERTLNRGQGSQYLESWGYFSDNTTSFLMSMPVSSMRESMGFFNHFLLIIGIISTGFGALVIYAASSRITRPINELAFLSEKMSRLDFTARYEGSSEDEIGILGKSMNTLSANLEKSIGDLKTANNELEMDIENKREVDRRRQEFVANVSHELKTPIALIQGYAEGLQDGMAEDPESREYYCSVIVDEAQKMNRMVRELLNLSSIEQGRDVPEIKLFNLSKVVSGVVASQEILIRQSGAHVEVDVPEDTEVWADEFKIEEVVTNYLNNALHHLQPPSQISIFTEKKPNQVIYLHVTNTGSPIPEEDLDRVWDKFYKVDKAHTRAYGGNGLGLSIVKAIAEAHHQSCGVKNTRTGVDFWFTLDGEDKSICRILNS